MVLPAPLTPCFSASLMAIGYFIPRVVVLAIAHFIVTFILYTALSQSSFQLIALTWLAVAWRLIPVLTVPFSASLITIGHLFTQWVRWSMHMSILFGTFSSGALLCACTHVAFPGFRLIRLFLSFRTCIYPTVLLMSHRRPHQECLVSLPGELCGPLGDFVRLAILNTPGRLTYFILFTYLLYCYTHVEVSCKY